MSTPAAPPRVGRLTVILALCCTAQFMVVLDVSIVNVALPSIGRELHYSSTGLQWVVNAYVLTFAGFLLLGGRAADLHGLRRRGACIRKSFSPRKPATRSASSSGTVGSAALA